MRTYTLHELHGGEREEISELDLRYLLGQVKNDLKYQRTRSAGRGGNNQDANAAKIRGCEALCEKLKRLLKEETIGNRQNGTARH